MGAAWARHAMCESAFMRQEVYFTGWCLTSSGDAGNIDAGTFIVWSQYMVRNDGALVAQD